MKTTHTSQKIIFSAQRIAEILASNSTPERLPTPEQQTVIEHPLSGSTLVIAGAGSGKTETMASRVVWLIANGLIAPEHVLGLTFTRKAAGELSERIGNRLRLFGTRLEDARQRGTLNTQETEAETKLGTLLREGLDLPTVSTYDSFASSIVQEFAPTAGLLSDATIIDASLAWKIARETVTGSTDDDLILSKLPLSRLVQLVINLDHAVSNHLTSCDSIDQVIAEFSRVTNLPYNEKKRHGTLGTKLVHNAVNALAETPLITRLTRAYASQKKQRGLIEFSDQLVLATRTIELSDAKTTLRDRHRVILLDEVQDTSAGQTRLLSNIFSGSSVMAVGDPKQSIYGWRGASAQGLRSFHQDFASTQANNPSTTLTLSTSFRNPKRVLQAANRIAQTLTETDQTHGLHMPELSANTGADSGSVEWKYPETIDEEQQTVAQWMRQLRQTHFDTHQKWPSAAVIFRTRNHMPAFAKALTDENVPCRIIGLGGLLSTPEITDIVCTLRCIWYADADSELIRLLTGPRFRIGIADIAGLARATRWFSQRDNSQQPLSEEELRHDSVLPDPDQTFSLLDTLDSITQLQDTKHPACTSISTVGRTRLQEAGRMLARLRQAISGNIGELIHQVVYALRTDIELEANETRGHEGTSKAQANINMFAELVEGYLALDTRGTLASLLEWIERATVTDETDEHVSAPEPGTVHLITAHGAKGLEWDLVAVPRLVDGEFPSTPRNGTGWLRTGQLPDELRSDASAYPKLNWRIATTQKELNNRIKTYAEELKERHLEEERRVAYVAFTRATKHLLLTGSFWAGHKNQRTPSKYLRELDTEHIITGLPQESSHTENPRTTQEHTLQWPRDPLGTRRNSVERAATALTQAINTFNTKPHPKTQEELETTTIDPAVQLLIEDQRHRHTSPTHSSGTAKTIQEHHPAEHITASTFHEYITHPQQSERNRLRPIPQQPHQSTRLGNLFHQWVERRATTIQGTALPLSGIDPELATTICQDSDTETELQPLIQQFERSRWATLKPIAVETEVTLPFANLTLVCKLDAVYCTTTDQGKERYEIVDWKTGRPPATETERNNRFYQLDLYRHAYAQLKNIEPEHIHVTLFYVTEGIELAGGPPRSIKELETLWYEASNKLH